jgi:type IV pilus assembly protein PilC
MPALKKSPKQTPVKMSTFAYECTNNQGSKVKGEISALNITIAKADLRRQGLNPIKVRRRSQSLFSGKRRKKISPAEISYFSRQMATMMSAGVPLVQSFDIVAKGLENESMRDLVLSIKADVEAGRSFSEALRQHPMYFDPLFCSLVAAGEASGSLETMLDRIATYKEKTESLKRKIKKALFYPTAVMVVAIIVTAILLVFVVPQFEQLFKGFGADLPAFTKMIIGLSKIVQQWWWLFLGIIMLSVWGISYSKRKYPKVEHTFDRMLLKVPVVGSILHKAAIARFARTLSTTFAAGVPLVEALESVAGATGNIIYTTAVLKIRDEVSTGSQMQLAMRNTGIFPNMVIQMVAIGEESGSLDAMLGKIATIYEEEVDSAVDGLSSLLEPLIMAVLGVLVGGLVIAMYLPIFKMGSVI